MSKNRSKAYHRFLLTTFAISHLIVNAYSLTNTFIDEVLAKYGEKNGSSMSQARFGDLLKQLTLGNVYIEKLDKSCLYKGIHNGYKEEPRKQDEIPQMKPIQRLLRKKRSGDHGNDNGKEAESPRHQQHLKEHLIQCLTRKRLLQRHNLNDTHPISKADFINICPALIQQIDAGVCLHRHNCSAKPRYLQFMVNSNLVWAYGFVAITVVSLASLCIIAVIPCLEKGFYQRIMGYLVALAVGTLAGDALLHLIPHAFQSLLSSSETEHRQNIWKSCFVLLGMYAFFLVEQLMRAKTCMRCCNKKGLSQDSQKHKHTKDTQEDAGVRFSDLSSKDSNDKLHDDSCSCHDSTESLSGAQNSLNAKSDTKMLELRHITLNSNHDNHDPHDHLEYHDHHENPHDLSHDHGHSHGKLDKNTSIATVAWMVIVGDGFHNFSDGLAIGAAFAASYSSGISTAIAVFCHELPHEIGDFAVLIKSGMTIRQAICYNIVSAVLSYVGLVIGIVIGNYSDDGKQFALALTAGLFLYVALANMLPELTSSMADDVGDFWTLILPHLGIISGVATMLLISIYEDKF